MEDITSHGASHLARTRRGFVSEVLRCNSSSGAGQGDDKHDPALGNVPLTGGWRWRSGGGHLEGEGRR